MVTIAGLFLLLSGVLSTIATARNNSFSVQSISYFILGLGALLIAAPYFTSEGDDASFLPYILIAILAIHFFLGEVSKNKTSMIWNIFPILAAVSLLLIPDSSQYGYRDYNLDGNLELFIIAILSVITPILIHLAKLGIGNLIIRFGNIKWAENEENYLEGLVSYAFIGGVAALGNFLLGSIGLVIAGTFYLSTALISRNKLGLKSNIIFSAGGALFLLISTPLILDMAGYSELNFLRGEVLEGAFVAGFMVLIHELFMKLARFNQDTWKVVFTSLAVLFPLLAVGLIGGAYNSFERLGGVLSLAGMASGLAVLSITFALFKNSSSVSLKLMTLGAIILLIPYVKPAEQTSGIDMEALGITTDDKDSEDGKSEEEKKSDEPKGKPLSEAIGDWKINEENSKIFFELGPSDGRTKGEFKKVKGNITFAETLENSKVDVTLPIRSMTTYIAPRDEELMGKGYFKADEYPEITYTSTSIKVEDQTLIVTGDFTMLGETNAVEVKLKLLGVGSSDGSKTAVLWGASSVDRTKFGMEPSSKIGNVVDFHFEVQLDGK